MPGHLGLVRPHTASFGFACDVPRRTRLWTASLPAIGNGIRAVVVHCCDRLLDVLVLTGKCAGQRHYLPRVPMSSDANALPFRLVRLSLSALRSMCCTVPPTCSHLSKEVLLHVTCSQKVLVVRVYHGIVVYVTSYWLHLVCIGGSSLHRALV